MKIETERLILRNWKEEDSLPFFQMNSDPEVMKLLLKELTHKESDELLTKIKNYLDEHNYGYWAVEEKSSGKLAGFTGLMPFPPEVHFAPAIQISWRFAKEFWGKGYASEAARASLKFGFEQLNLSKIVSVTVPHNTRSIAVMERIGMKRDINGDFDHPVVPDNHPLKRHVLYRISSQTEIT